LVTTLVSDEPAAHAGNFPGDSRFTAADGERFGRVGEPKPSKSKGVVGEPLGSGASSV